MSREPSTIESILANDVTLGSVDEPGLDETPPVPTLLVAQRLAVEGDDEAVWKQWRKERLAVAAQAGQVLRKLGGGWLRYQDEECGFYRNSVTGEESFGRPRALLAKGRRRR